LALAGLDGTSLGTARWAFAAFVAAGTNWTRLRKGALSSGAEAEACLLLAVEAEADDANLAAAACLLLPEGAMANSSEESGNVHKCLQLRRS
jgi:hypothetical protein